MFTKETRNFHSEYGVQCASLRETSGSSRDGDTLCFMKAFQSRFTGKISTIERNEWLSNTVVRIARENEQKQFQEQKYFEIGSRQDILKMILSTTTVFLKALS